MASFETFLRNFLKFGNFAVIFIGLCIVGGGVWMRLDQDQIEEVGRKIRKIRGSYYDFLDELYDDEDSNDAAERDLNNIYHHKDFDYILITLGSITVLMGLMGFGLVKRETSCCVCIYVFAILLLFTIQISAIVILSYHNSSMDAYKKRVGSLLHLDLTQIDGPEHHQMAFFAVSSILTILYFFLAVIYCCAKRIPMEDTEKTSGYEKVTVNNNRHFQRKFSKTRMEDFLPTVSEEL